jgi:type IV pilus assembly protein PilA
MTETDTAQLRAALGANADQYRRRFDRIEASGRRWLPGWNSAAFLHSTAWFFYRRMYLFALLNFLAPWILLFALVFMGGSATPVLVVFGGYFAGVFILIPLFADSIYYRHLAARLAKARPPSLWTALGATALALASFILCLATLVPTYADYTPRAKMSEVVLATSGMRNGVTEFHHREGRFPSAEEAPKFNTETGSKYVESISYDATRRAIVAVTREPWPGTRIVLYAVEQNGQLAWRCRGIGIDKKNLPQMCRD